MPTSKIATLLLRIGIAFAFLYPPTSAIFDPYAWVGYFPQFILTYSQVENIVLLHLFGLLELCIGVWILYGKKIIIPLSVAGILLFLIIVFNLNHMDVLFRDIPILFMVITLILITKEDK